MQSQQTGEKQQLGVGECTVHPVEGRAVLDLGPADPRPCQRAGLPRPGHLPALRHCLINYSSPFSLLLSTLFSHSFSWLSLTIILKLPASLCLSTIRQPSSY